MGSSRNDELDLKMNFCIIGDSFGNYPVGYYPPEGNRPAVNVCLEQKSHWVVKNLSAMGASNIGQLRMLKHYIEETTETIDYIIWFHTEPARSFNEFISLVNSPDKEYDRAFGKERYPDIKLTSVQDDIDYIRRRDYDFAQEIYEQTNIPFIVVGAAGRLGDMSKYSFPIFSVENWTNLITDNCYVTHVAAMNEYKDSRYDKGEFLDVIEKLEKQERSRINNPDWPDRYHLSAKHYCPLVNDILLEIL